MRIPLAKLALMLMDELRLKNDRWLVILMLGLLLLPPLQYVCTDSALYAGEPVRLSERFVVRSFMLAVPIIGVLLVRYANTREQYERVVLAVVTSMALLLIAINVLRPAGSTIPLRSPLFHIAVMYGALPNTFWRQVVPPLLLSAGLAVLHLTRLTGGAAGDAAGDLLILTVQRCWHRAREAAYRPRARRRRRIVGGARSTQSERSRGP